MKQSKKRRFLALLLVCVLTLSLPLAVSAAEIKKVSLFTTYAGYVEEFVATRDTGKSFRAEQIPANAVIYIAGWLYHSDTTTATKTIRSGICYLSGDDYYSRVSGLYHETYSGEQVFRAKTQQSMDKYITYYGFIKNLAGYGGVNGGNFETYYKYS